MATTIRDASGKQALLSTLRNPFDFIRAFNTAAGAGKGAFGADAMAVLEGVERRTYPALPVPTSRR